MSEWLPGGTQTPTNSGRLVAADHTEKTGGYQEENHCAALARSVRWLSRSTAGAPAGSAIARSQPRLERSGETAIPLHHRGDAELVEGLLDDLRQGVEFFFCVAKI
ncbi:MAG: hypothetical protein LLG97_02885 [Deltaproteobacteria bacterium]|nr:hypothetical protein [Deltaproteobacteria bacterium]